jgi:DNA invertase Pin-like site-specific DNA recombinase
MTKRAAIYARQSLDVNEGIDRQLDRCRKLIDARGWTVAAEYRDNDTSASKKRDVGTAWADLLAAISAGSVDVVVAVDLDRLLRTTRDLLALTDLGIPVLTVDGEIDLTTADGEFRATMLAGIARFEVRRKSERQKRANTFRISQGKPVPGGRRRFGFESDHLTVRADEADWVRLMYSDAAEGASLRSIAAKLNAAGVPCVTKGVWDYRRIRKILVNPAYSGKVIHDGLGHDSNIAPIIVEPDLAARVLAIMTNPARRLSPGPQRSALLGGLAECGTCGAPMISAGTKHRGINIATYACKAVKEGGKDGRTHPTIRRAIADQPVPGMVYSALIARLLEGDEPEEAESPVGHLLAQVADIERRRVVVQELATMPGVNLAHTKAQLAALGKELTDAWGRIDSFAIASARGNLIGNARQVVDRMRAQARLEERADVVDTIANSIAGGEAFLAEWAELTLEEKRSLLRSVLRVVINSSVVSRKTAIVPGAPIPGLTGKRGISIQMVREGPERIQFVRTNK